MISQPLTVAVVLLSPVARVMSVSITVVSYNMYWWNANGNGALYNKIKEHPADIYGFQECEDVSSTVNKAGLRDYEAFQGPNKPDGNPAPLAWNRNVFEKLTEPDSEWIASDQYKNRYANVVRLRHKASGATVIFSNTHGPLNNCGNTVGDNWVKSIIKRKQDGDTAIMTGDFNCKPGTTAINKVEGLLQKKVHNWVDFILTTSSSISGGHHEGWPSDHELMKAEIDIGEGGSTPPVGDDTTPPKGDDTTPPKDEDATTPEDGSSTIILLGHSCERPAFSLVLALALLIGTWVNF